MNARIAVMGLLLVSAAYADDEVSLKNGKSVRCQVQTFSNDYFVCQMDDGTTNNVPSSSVTQITFNAPKAKPDDKQSGKGTELKYDTKSGWKDTGIQVEKGQKVTITASGIFTTGLGMPMVDADGYKSIREDVNNLKKATPYAKFFAALSSAPTRFYEIGKKGSFIAGSSGTLMIGLNNKWVGNDSGELTVVITIGR